MDRVPFTHYAEVNPARDIERGRPTPFVEMAAVPEGGGNVRYLLSRHFDGSGSRFRVGDTLFARITPCTENGKVTLVKDLKGNNCGFGSTEFIVLAPRRGVSEPAFVFQVAASPMVRLGAVAKMLGSSGRQRVPAWFFTDALTLPLFSLDEQKIISAMLASLDLVIEKTEAVITTTEQLRSALLQDLLTRGIPGWHREWKMVAGLGMVPKSWTVEALTDLGSDPENVVLTGPFGAELRSSDFASTGVPVINIGNVRAGRLDLRKVDRVSEVVAGRLSKYQVMTGDILFSRMASVGRAAVVPPDLEGGLISYHLMRVRVNPGRILPEFLMSAIQWHPRVRQQIVGASGGGTRPGINSTSLRQVRLPVPPLQEQRKIVEAATAVERRGNIAASALGHLRQLREVVAATLLSGHVRIPEIRRGK